MIKLVNFILALSTTPFKQRWYSVAHTLFLAFLTIWQLKQLKKFTIFPYIPPLFPIFIVFFPPKQLILAKIFLKFHKISSKQLVLT